MVHPKVPTLSFLLLALLPLLPLLAAQDHPVFDPRVSEFVWFDTQHSQDSIDHEDHDDHEDYQDHDDYSSSVINGPYILPGAVEPILDLTKDKYKVPTVEKFDLRL